MAQLMLVNPRRRRRRAKTSANPRRRRRKMSALQRQYFGGGRRKRRASASAAPVRRRRRHRARTAVVRAAAPRRHRRRRSIASFARNTSGRLSLHSITSGGFISSTIMPAAMGAVGALGLDFAYGMLPIPPQFKAGNLAPLVKVASIIGIGALLSGVKIIPQRFVQQAVAAGVTIQAYNYLRNVAQTMVPNIPLGAYLDGYNSPAGMGYTGAGVFLPDNTMGSYISGADAPVAWSHTDSNYADFIN